MTLQYVNPLVARSRSALSWTSDPASRLSSARRSDVEANRRRILVTVVRLALVALLVAAPAATSPPASAPPQVSGAGTAPPPAWIELPDTPSRWLAYGSYCWRTGCVDFLPPQMRPDLPRARARVGSTVRFHVGFKPSLLRLELVDSGRTYTLRPARSSAWRVARLGTISLRAKGPPGTVTYVLRIR